MASRTALFFDVFAIDKTKRTFSQILKSTDSLGSKLVAVGKLAGVAAAGGLAVFAAKGVKSFLQFDDKMTQSLAIMGEVSGPMRKRMEDAAKAVATSTRFGASQAAESYFFLASAGLDAEQSIAAMPQVAKFAQAGMFDLARATDLATDAQSALGLTVPDAEKNLANLTHVTDVLVGANTLANASVEQFSAALTNRAGPAIRAVNKPIEEGVAVLAAFADQGIKGEEAGTRLDIVMRDLQTRALKNADAFKRANVEVFDQQGKMNNLGDIIGQLETRLGGMTDAQKRAELQTLGFTDRSIASLLALLGTSDAIKQYEEDLKSMAGITEDVADAQMEAFAAKLQVIKNRAEIAGIALGGVLVNAVFSVGEHVGEMARMFGELPDSVKIGIGAFAALAAGAPLAIGAFRKIKSAIETARIALMLMSTTARTATLAMGGIGIALAAGAAILAFFANQNLEARARVDALADSLDRQTGALTENTRDLAANNLQQSGAIDKAKELGINLETLTSAYLGDKDAIAEVNAALAEHEGKTEEQITGSNTVRDVLTDEAKAARDVKDAVREGNEETDEAITKARDHATAVGDTADADDELAVATAAATTEIEDQTSAIEELISELDAMVQTVFAARDAERGYEQALDDAREALEENGKTLDIGTEKGRKNQEQLDRLAESALKDAEATLQDAEAKGDLAAGHDEATAKMETARDEFVKLGIEMGLEEEAAEALADELGLIPGNYNAKVIAETRIAEQRIENFLASLNRIPAFKTVHMSVSGGIRAGVDVARQHGGPVSFGQVALVGEQGPELVTFDQNAHVIPADETQRLLRGGDGASIAGGPIIVENHIEIGGEVVRVVRTEISAHDRNLKRRAMAGTGLAR